MRTPHHFVERLWDILCCISIVGIWPRFIEPSILCTSRYTIPLPDLSAGLEGFRILHISDLHFSSHTTKQFLQRIQNQIHELSPHLIVFTGDLLTYSELDPQKEDDLFSFLDSLQAPFGCYAILGNHDYAKYVSLAKDGSYRQIQDHIPTLIAGFFRLFGIAKESFDPVVCDSINQHDALMKLYAKAGIRVLHNETEQIGVGSSAMNLTGLGDIMTKQCDPFTACTQCDPKLPTIVLSHNPDSYTYLRNYPGDLILFGHTHGGQVNLPFVWKKITPLKNKKYKSGLFQEDGRFLFVNRGLGATLPFRLFAPPEIALLTLVRSELTRSPAWYKAFSFQTKPILTPSPSAIPCDIN